MTASPKQKTPLHLRITCDEWLKMFNQLDRAELGVFYYIKTQDPFGDRVVEANSNALATLLGIHRSSVSRALKNLSQKGFISLEIVSARASTKVAQKLVCMDAQEMCVDAQEMCMDAQEMCVDAQEHNIDRARVHTINTNSDSHTLSYKDEGEKILDQNSRFGFEIAEATVQSSATLLKKEASQVTNQIVVKANVPPTRVDPFFNRRRDPKDISWDWLPDGPWRNEEGKLDAAFWTAIATRWVKEHGGDIHEKKVNVLKHFRNEPTNLPMEWEWYQSVTIHRVANIQTRKMHGFDTEGEEQAMMKHTAALKSLPDVMRVTATRGTDKLLSEIAPYSIPSIEQSQAMPAADIGIPLAAANDLLHPEVATDIWDIVADQTEAWEQKQIAPEGADNLEAYKSVEQAVSQATRDYWAELDQKRKHPDVSSAASITTTSQPIKEQIMNLAERKSMPRASAQDKKDQIRLSHWNNLLATGLPSVMADAERQALKAGYIIVDGQVVEPEF
ncbi:MAG: helix-turn-helix domain-containing protein [Nostoc sp.]|uniref:MarR family transcriptional regulator n=1 Tax=Nostoc sp. TaxID=1180 RepID=UPI002FF0F2B6